MVNGNPRLRVTGVIAITGEGDKTKAPPVSGALRRVDPTSFCFSYGQCRPSRPVQFPAAQEFPARV